MATKWKAYCLVCCGGGKDLTAPTSKKKAECEATSHSNMYGHRVTVIETKKETP